MKKKILMLSIISMLAVSNFTMVSGASPMPPTATVESADTAKSDNHRVLRYQVVPHGENITVETFVEDNIKTTDAYQIIYTPNDETLSPTNVGVVLAFTNEQYEQSGLSNATAYYTKKTDDLVYLIMPNMTLSFKYPDSPEDAKNFESALKNINDVLIPYNLSTEYNRIEGITANYMFELPEDIAFLAFNDTYNDTTGAIEKINIEFTPMNRMEQSATIMEFYVYDRNEYNDSDDIVKIKDANGYVFAVKLIEENPFKVEADKVRYDEYITTLKNNDYEGIINGLILPQISDNTGAGKPSIDKTSPTRSNKFVIDGVETDIEYVTIGEGRKGVPVRAILEELGYEVSWDSENQKVSFVKGPVTGDMTIGSTNYNYLRKFVKMDMPPMIMNNSAVVPIEFLAQVLPYSYEIQENGALYLTTK